MGNSKVIYNGSTLIDLTGDTVAADVLLAGYTAHGKDGEAITGTYEGGGSSAVKFVMGTFTASGDSSITVTFDESLDNAPYFVMFWEGNNSTSYRSTARVKYAMGGTSSRPIASGSASSYYYQRCGYGSTSISTSSITSTSYTITYTGTGTTSSSYPCIRAATSTGFKAYQRYYNSTYPLYGTYNYIAICE